jgi:hypothetical protein
MALSRCVLLRVVTVSPLATAVTAATHHARASRLVCLTPPISTDGSLTPLVPRLAQRHTVATLTPRALPGDYSAVGMTHLLRIERKADDLISCCGSDRERFMDQMQRLAAFPLRALIVEWTWARIEMGGWRGKVSPASVRGTLLGIVAMGIPVITAGCHQRAGELTSRLMVRSSSAMGVMRSYCRDY